MLREGEQIFDEHYRTLAPDYRPSCRPAGRAFLADDACRTPDELVEGPASAVIQRRTPDGTAFRVVKVPHRPDVLERELRQLGWDITVTPTAGPFCWGAGGRASLPPVQASTASATW